MSLSPYINFKFYIHANIAIKVHNVCFKPPESHFWCIDGCNDLEKDAQRRNKTGCLWRRCISRFSFMNRTPLKYSSQWRLKSNKRIKPRKLKYYYMLRKIMDKLKVWLWINWNTRNNNNIDGHIIIIILWTNYTNWPNQK